MWVFRWLPVPLACGALLAVVSIMHGYRRGGLQESRRRWGAGVGLLPFDAAMRSGPPERSPLRATSAHQPTALAELMPHVGPRAAANPPGAEPSESHGLFAHAGALPAVLWLQQAKRPGSANASVVLTQKAAPAAKAAVITDVVVDWRRNITTVIGVHPYALAGGRKVAAGSKPWDGKFCGWSELPFNRTRIARQGFNEWAAAAPAGHKCTAIPTISTDANVDMCITITQCRGTFYGQTRGAISNNTRHNSMAIRTYGTASSITSRVSVVIGGITGIPRVGLAPIAEMVAVYQYLKCVHIYIGFAVLRDDSVIKQYTEALRPWIKTGFVSLHAYSVRLGAQRGDDVKLGFLNTALYHAKVAGDDWLIVHDADELVVFRDFNPKVPASTAISALLQKYAPQSSKSKENLCYIELVGTGLALPSNASTVFLGDRFKRRAASGGYPFGYRKSIVNVKRSFFVGLHAPGSCTVQGDVGSTNPNYFGGGEGSHVVKIPVEVTGVNHYVELFIDRKIDKNLITKLNKVVPDEYAVKVWPLIRPILLKQMEQS